SFKENQSENPTITIETKDLHDGISIEFRDNASSIDEEIIEKIFDPYFSTKIEKKGSGLGLYMSKIIIEDHHRGELYARNNNEGVGFIIFIPK
ncbi:MAG: hypothetical protein HRT43_08955, partial [Campylobacteraceae bacterium]|nr:hypothetical protein [Campylobacteraceae bacterium]